MASPLARQALHLTCNRIIASGSTRKINTTACSKLSPSCDFFLGLTFCQSAQDSWFYRLFKRKSVTEKPQLNASEKAGFDSKNQDGLPLSKAPEGAEAQSKHVAVKSAAQFESQPAQTAAPKESKSAAADRRKRTRRIVVCARNADHKVQLFNENVEFMKPRLGHKPEIHHPRIRKSTWIRTLALCQTEEQLRKVMQMIPLWRDMGLNFDSTFSHAFISTLPNIRFCYFTDLSLSGRCLYLDKPEYALELFGDFGKYNVPLTVDGAREMLSVTYNKQPIGFIITVMRLFNVYKLGHVKNDYPCCAMVIAACLKSKRKDAMILADSLLPHLKNMVETSVLPQMQETSQKLSLP